MARPRTVQTGGGGGVTSPSANPLADVVRYFLTAPIQEAQNLIDTLQVIVAHRWQETVAEVRKSPAAMVGGPITRTVDLSVPQTAVREPLTSGAPIPVSALTMTPAVPVVRPVRGKDTQPRRRRVPTAAVAAAIAPAPATREEDVPLPGLAPTPLPDQATAAADDFDLDPGSLPDPGDAQ